MQTIQIHLNIGHVGEHEACGSTVTAKKQLLRVMSLNRKPAQVQLKTCKGHVSEHRTYASPANIVILL